MTQQLVALNEFLRHPCLHKRLEFLVVGSRDSIPELRRSAVMEVDARHVEILHVPGKYGPEPTDIKIRRVDAGERSLSQGVAF